MISFWHVQIENNANITSLLGNPPDIGLTPPSFSLAAGVDAVRPLRTGRLPQTPNEEDLP
jgi:hypothetical protein